MKKLIENTPVLVMLLLYLMLFTNCNGKNTGYAPTEGSANPTKAVIEKNIKELADKAWNKKAYEEIREKQIPCLKLPSEKKALRTLLDATYGKVMIRDANKIMDGECIGQHKRLEALLVELKGFPDAGGLSELHVRKAHHDKLVQFVHTLTEPQRVRNFTDRYDTSYEQEKKTKAKEYLATRPTCSYLKNNLSHPDAWFQTRRKKFCENIIAIYLQKETYDEGDENILLSRLNIYQGDRNEWKSQIDNFREEKLAEQTEENTK